MEGVRNMMNFNLCPSCKSEISEDRLQYSPIICNHCGHTQSKTQNEFNKKTNLISIFVFFFLSIAISASFLHSVRWGNHSFAVIPHKVLIAFGLADDSNFEALQQICIDRKMIDCVQASLEDQFADNPQNLEVLKKLGKLYYQRKNYTDALEILNSYFTLQGDDLMTAYYFAKTLSLEGEIDKASEYFEFILASKPDVLQVTVTETYMDMLIADNRYEDAKKLAKSVEERTEKIPGTLLARFNKVDEALNPTPVKN